jgi:hypothetical protein
MQMDILKEVEHFYSCSMLLLQGKKICWILKFCIGIINIAMKVSANCSHMNSLQSFCCFETAVIILSNELRLKRQKQLNNVNWL